MPGQDWFSKIAEQAKVPSPPASDSGTHEGQDTYGNTAFGQLFASGKERKAGKELGSVNSTIKLSEAAPDAGRILAGAIKLVDVGEGLKEKGTGYLWDDEELIQSGKNMLGLAAALTKIGHGVANMAEQDIAVELDSTGHYLKHAGTFLSAVDLTSRLLDRDAADAFMEDPTDLDKAEAWAKDVAGTFKSVGGLIDAIPDGGLPGYMKTYWKGLMNAPANYVDAFMVILKAHLGEIDKVAGSWEKTKVVGPDNTSLWEGPLSGLYNKAQLSSPRGLDSFMREHRRLDGTDLWEAKGPLGKALLLTALYEEVGHGDEVDGGAEKRGWIDLVADFRVY